MDPLDCQTDEELSNLFHCKKTEISSMEEPQAFLNELRKPNLVPENLYEKVMKMRTTERRQDVVYQILDQLEKKGGHSVRLFWRCVFQDHMLQKYPNLRLLWNSLKEGQSDSFSFFVYEQIPDAPEEPNTKESDKKGLKRKISIEGTDEEEPGTSSHSTSQPKKPESPQNMPSQILLVFQAVPIHLYVLIKTLLDEDPVSWLLYAEFLTAWCSDPDGKLKPTWTGEDSTAPLLKEGEKQDIWSLISLQKQLHVTCGNKKGTLHKEKLAKGDECILSEGLWFTPGEFEKFAGKRSKKWKESIRCYDIPLQKIIEVIGTTSK
ncbi:uncharacterized protein LOC134301731 [Trichomycterus rosablanca]|uniref:uncharacterized protein LOC134301731 n=1 Tax=Trichomycterus rosablanca TaxID=2290929 RepID=UPI002F355E42